jgi:hypothetical protein
MYVVALFRASASQLTYWDTRYIRLKYPGMFYLYIYVCGAYVTLSLEVE